MDSKADLQKVQKLPLLKTRNSSSSFANSEVEDDNEPRYTSLKDLILSSSSSSTFMIQEGNNEIFDSSKIMIRNQLVKSAASAYLQSAAILATKEENWLLNMWGKLKNNVETSYSYWNLYFRDPLVACFQPIYQFLRRCFGQNFR